MSRTEDGDELEESGEDHHGFDDEVEELLERVAQLERTLDLAIDSSVHDDENEPRLLAATLWVRFVLEALSTLQAPIPVDRSEDVLRDILDVAQRRKRAAELSEQTRRELLECRDSGRMSREDVERILRRWERMDERRRELPAPPGEAEILNRKLFLELAKARIRELPQVASNTIALAPWALTVRLPPTVGSYVAKVARNFIDGRHVEGVIVARAVLDAAMKDKVQDRQVLTHSSKILRESEVTLLDRIKFAERIGLLSAAAARMAHSIRIRGNDAVHVNNPPFEGFVGDFDYVRGLTKVLMELYSLENDRIAE